jgi:hypothetical protein
VHPGALRRQPPELEAAATKRSQRVESALASRKQGAQGEPKLTTVIRVRR